MTEKDSGASLAQTVAIIAVTISMVVVVVNLLASLYFTPERLADMKMRTMAEDYYENYFYGRFIESVQSDGEEVTSAFEKYVGTGFAPVRLRQLLTYGDEKFSSWKKYFDNDSYGCDENLTTATVTPVAPYGEKDYELTVSMSCSLE